MRKIQRSDQKALPIELESARELFGSFAERGFYFDAIRRAHIAFKFKTSPSRCPYNKQLSFHSHFLYLYYVLCTYLYYFVDLTQLFPNRHKQRVGPGGVWFVLCAKAQNSRRRLPGVVSIDAFASDCDTYSVDAYARNCDT